MNKRFSILILIVMFALALGAGVVAGKLSSRITPAEVPTARRSNLPDALSLSEDQRVKMQTIWEGVRETSHRCLAEAQKAQREQDEALMAMLTDEQKNQYAKLNQQTEGKIAVLDARRKVAFSKAVDDTNAILNETQRKIYGQIIKDRIGEMPDGTWERP